MGDCYIENIQTTNATTARLRQFMTLSRMIDHSHHYITYINQMDAN